MIRKQIYYPLLSSTSYNQTFNFSPLTSRQLANLCGILHENIKVLEGYFNLNIKVGYDEVMLTGGSTQRFTKVKKIIEQLHRLSDNPIPKAHITTLLNEEDLQIVWPLSN